MPSTIASGNRAIVEAIARRWQTPRGGLVDDPNYGYDLSDFVGDDLNIADVGLIAQMASAEAVKDERVQSCEVTVKRFPNGTMEVTGVGRSAIGPFRLVVGVSQVSVSLLQVTNT